MENNELYIFTVSTRTFGGKVKMSLSGILEEVLDCAEFIPMFDNRGGLGLVCVLIGSISSIPKESLIIKVDKKSLYYQSYVKATTGIEIGGRGTA